MLLASDSTRVTHKSAHRETRVVHLVSASAVMSEPVTTVMFQFVTEFRQYVLTHLTPVLVTMVG